ncbi:MAG: GTP 3',8-cyclase MoaA [Bariatricus sp.]
MRDSFGREIDYMRISITDRCNLRCRYCMPDGISWIPMEEILTYEEIKAVVEEAAKLGIKKIKVTGGEPLVRLGCPALVGMLKEVPGIEQVTLTTNGVYLVKYAEELKHHGLDAVNVSLDTLDAERFERITGRDGLDAVLEGIQAALKLQIPVKVNSVLQKEENENEWKALAELARHRKLDVRFIEMMPIGYGKRFEPVYNEVLLKKFKEEYGALEPDTRIHGNGPAVYYQIPGFEGSVGFISAIHGKFCDHCNRIRMTSTGDLKACLCFEEQISVRKALRAGDREEVRRLMEAAIRSKPAAHQFEKKEMITEKREMASIGG